MFTQNTVDSAVKARCKRGVQLAREGRVKRRGALFVVRGRTGNYTVCLDHQTFGESCSCKDWRINVLEKGNLDHRCKHIIACTLIAAKR